VPLRVAFGGIEHETSTYAVAATTTGDFRVARDDEVRKTNRGVRGPIGGMLSAADAIGAQITGLLHAGAQAGGVIARSAYETLRGELIARVRSAGPLDAVCLSLHGAGLVEEVGDLEADLVDAIRTAVRPATQILVASICTATTSRLGYWTMRTSCSDATVTRTPTYLIAGMRSSSGCPL
jgi:microcystin degradation protein MlrC